MDGRGELRGGIGDRGRPNQTAIDLQRRRLAEQIALHDLAAGGLQDVGLDFGLDPLGDRVRLSARDSPTMVETTAPGCVVGILG